MIGRKVVLLVSRSTLIPDADQYLSDFLLNSFKKNKIKVVFEEKIKRVEDKAKYLSMETNFKTQFLNQISLRDFIVNDENDICDLIENAHKDLIKYRTKPLSILL